MIHWLILLWCLVALPSIAETDAQRETQKIQPHDIHLMADMAVMHEGRIKPMESVARATFRKVAGRSAPDDISALEWFVAAAFTPSVAMTQEVIAMGSAPLKAWLGFADDKRKNFSFLETASALDARLPVLQKMMDKPAADQSSLEKEIIGLYAAVQDYSHLLTSLTLMLPDRFTLSPALQTQLGLEKKDSYTYLEIYRHADFFMNALKKIRAKKNNVALYTAQEMNIAQISYALSGMTATGDGNTFLRVVPTGAEWSSLWQLVNDGKGAPHYRALMEQWKKLAWLYYHHHPQQWRETLANLKRETGKLSPQPLNTLALEVFYHHANLYAWAAALYGVVFALILLPLPANTSANKPARIPFHQYIFAAAVVCHALSIVLRMIILGRPPVSSLYESLLFVSLVLAVITFVVGRQRALYMAAGSLFCAFLLLISPVYAPAGDSMGVLVAVLNTRFWLATHVVCITVGYAVAFLAGILAHLHLWKKETVLPELLRSMALSALLFTSVGTMLGGIWADQSWGRFWGWDPKENGALLIVLWLIWLLHGRMTNMLQPRAFAAFLACTNIMVAVAWLGVNLLGTGLHSYGFTNAAGVGFVAFCVAEMIIITFLFFRSRHHAS